MFQKTVLTLLLATALQCLPWPAAADDTDIYLDPRPAPGAEPLVMFSIDYRSNLASSANSALPFFAGNPITATDPAVVARSLTRFDVLRLALKIVLTPLQGIKVGLMFNHFDENNCAGFQANQCSNGGVMLMGFQPLEANDSTGALATFLSKLSALKTLNANPNSPDHPYQGSELFFEFFRYLTGQGILNGHNGAIDFEKGNCGNNESAAQCETDQKIVPSTNMRCGSTNTAVNPACFDSSIETDNQSRYQSALSSIAACSKIFTMNFLFAVSQKESQSQSAIEAAKTAGGLGITLPPSQNDWFATVVRFLHDADLADGSFGPNDPTISGAQNVTSYFFVDDVQGLINQATDYARAGGTNQPRSFSTNNPQALIDGLNAAFREILSVSTTFTASSIPVNAFNRADIVNNVFFALFQADKNAKPAWPGNVKKLRRIQNADGTTAGFVDALNNPGLATDGRISLDALTLWTTGGDSALPADPDNNVPAGRDGRVVQRGGAGQQIPGFLSGGPGFQNSDAGARKLFYDSGPTTLTALNATTTALTNDPTLVTSLCDTDTNCNALGMLRWARGQNIDGLSPNCPPGSASNDPCRTQARPWIMGDPLHSRPVPINYGALSGFSTTNPAIYLAVATNDGFLHFIRNTNTDGTESGQEVWGFMPKEVMGKLRTLRTNAPTDPFSHPSLIDGSPAVLIDDVNQNGTIESGDHVYLYIGMRRGGRSYYAFDVTNPEAPTGPTLLWKITPSTSGFSELGLTFSTPQIGQVNVRGTTKPALFFAGGFDHNNNKDRDALGTDDASGNAIYVVDAVTGALIWKAVKGATTGPVNSTTYAHENLTDSIPSDVTIVDTNNDRLIDRILVGDTGGQVWRADLVGPNTSDWTLTRLANVGRHFQNDKANDRRFFGAPDLVQHRDDRGPYDAVIIGSGDRENPLDFGSGTAGVEQNWFYVIKDRRIAIGEPSPAPDPLVHTDFADVTDATLDPNLDPNIANGWRLMLDHGVSGRSAEKAVTSPITAGGTIFFTTFVPPPPTASQEATTCGPGEGSGLQYALKLDDATAVFDFNTSEEGFERTVSLNSPGIPPQDVALPKEILPPGSDQTLPVGKTRHPTFWQRVDISK